MPETSAAEAAKIILNGRATADLKSGVLDLSLAQTKKPVQLPEGLSCFSLNLAGQPIASLPTSLRVEFKLDLTGCTSLTELPRGLAASTIILANCTRLAALPEDLRSNFLQLDGCRAMRHWPESAQVTCGWVRARGCAALERLPQVLGPLASLDLRDCRRIDSIPAGVVVRSWMDIGGTSITGIPETLRGVALRWRGVPITPQIAFFPETLKGSEILAERNTEVRRVMIERMGFERFLSEVHAEVLDTDRDPGGERRLLRVPLADDESIVVVSRHCPSTRRHYLVRVPPGTRTCRQAVAWTAGFDNPDNYAPVAET